MTELSQNIIALVKHAVEEDIGKGDLTSLGCLEPNRMKAKIVAKSEGVLSGTKPALLVFDQIDSANKVHFLKNDGNVFTRGDLIAEIDGFNLSLLASERTALNFLGRLSGIASLTANFVHRVKHTQCTILDTRKTTPGYRLLEKEAVVHGGGCNHRRGLDDMVLIKDNHISSAGSIRSAVEHIRHYMSTPDFTLQFETDPKNILIEVEVKNENELTEAIDCGVMRLLLDNQSPKSLKRMVERARSLNSEVKLEASGNVNLDNVADVAESGVDFISIGALTHSAPTSDFSMLVIE